MTNLWWTAAAYYGLAVTSALVPWVNAELIMLSAVPLAETQAQLGLLAGVVTLGQMTGKGAMYWVARRAHGTRAARLEPLIARWRQRFAEHPGSAHGVVLLSSAIGFPPFYLVSMMAGAFHMAFGRFFAIGLFGRLVHFSAVAFAPHLAWRAGLP